MRVSEAEREVEVLRDDLAQAQNRITTLLEMNQPGFQLGSEDEDGMGRRDSIGSSEEASMAFDKVSPACSIRSDKRMKAHTLGQFSKELKQWRGSEMGAETDDDDTAQ